jgi:hypothetical protein
MTYTITQKLTGQKLVDFVNAEMTKATPRTDICRIAGYVKTLRDGNIGPDFISFYENLLEARKETNPELFQTESDYPEYETLSDDIKALYDHLDESIASKWTHEETLDFIGELEDIGIETVEQFQDSFERTVDNTWKAEAEFSEEYMVELEHSLQDSLVFHAIDWQSVWDHQLKYDFNTIEFDGETYFFRNI